MALVIAGDRSGVGKTTVTLALLSALQKRGCKTQSFKVGPDYIDPMFHRAVTGRPCRNLDPVLTSETYVQQCFVQHSVGMDCALVEGVMGLFDGAAGTAGYASTAHIARLIDAPVLLVLDCSRLSQSIAAIAHGYRSFDPRVQIAGVVLNRVGSDRHLAMLKAALEPLAIPVLGVLRRQEPITIPDRHLGLVPTDELPELAQLFERLAHLGETSFDWSQLMPLLHVKPQVQSSSHPNQFQQLEDLKAAAETIQPGVRIAIAADRAFNFYYADNLDILQALGAELVFWSPLTEALPNPVQGLYLGGGFPEMFAAELSQNLAAKASVKQAILSGLPTYAECGGLMYLCDRLTDFQGNSWEMAGVLPTQAVMGDRLTLGYRRAIAQRNSPLLPAGTSLWGHEFHRSSLTTPISDPLYQIQPDAFNNRPTYEGWRLHQLHASYLHLHWGANPDIPLQFLRTCQSLNSQTSKI